MSETSQVVRPLMLALVALGVPCHRIHCGKVKVRGGWMHLNPEGLPDIGGTLPSSGQSFYVEAKGTHPNACKCDSCKAQRDTREKLDAAGALYVFARNVEDGLRGLGLTQ